MAKNMGKEEIFIYVDETCWQKGAAIGFVLIESGADLEKIKVSISDLENDPVFKMHKGNTKDGKRHFVNFSQGQRTHLVDRLRSLPVSVYVYILKDRGITGSVEDKKRAYALGTERMVNSLMLKHRKTKPRLVTRIRFENLSDNAGDDRVFFQECMPSVARMEDAVVEVVTKADPLTILPDSFLGVINSLACLPVGHTFAKSDLKVIGSRIGQIVIHEDGTELRYRRGDDLKTFIEDFAHSGTIKGQEPRAIN